MSGPTFADCVKMCAADAQFVAHVERLTGEKFGILHHRSPIEFAVDQATGRDEADVRKFCILVDEIVWSRLPKEQPK